MMNPKWGNMRRNSLLLIVLLSFLFVSVSHAAMTIWFKDGSSKDVNKIVFKGSSADLYLVNGQTLSVAVSVIDLPGSGIGAPVGTYGGTASGGSTGGGFPAAPAPQAAPLLDQKQLKAQYDESHQSAIADRDYGSIPKGQIVHVVIASDISYTVVYKDASDNYRKVTIDSSTFGENFTIGTEPSQNTVTPSLQPSTPPETVPPVTTNPPIPMQPDVNAPPAPGHKSLLDALEKQVVPPPASEEHSSILAPAMTALTIFLAAIGLAIYMMKRREREFIAATQIPRRQMQLETDIQQWQTEGKSKNELIERCLRKLHGDKPKALSASLKILRGDPKNLIVASIVRDSNQNAAQAELTYERLSQILDESRQLVDASQIPALPPAGAKAGAVSAAAVPDRNFSSAPSFAMVVRPTSISIASGVLFLAGIASVVLALGSETAREQAGMLSLGITIVFTFACAYGYWTMKRWAVVLYSLELVLRIYYGMSAGMIAIPAVIVAAGILNFHEMTWK